MNCPTCSTDLGAAPADGSDPHCATCYRAAFDPATKHAAALAALETALDTATEHHYQRDPGEAFTECHLCRVWEGHADECPIPAIEAFMNAGEPTPPPRVMTDEDAANARPGFRPPPAPARPGALPRPDETPPRAAPATIARESKPAAMLAALELRAALATELQLGAGVLPNSAIVAACAAPNARVRALAIAVAERRGIQIIAPRAGHTEIARRCRSCGGRPCRESCGACDYPRAGRQ